MYIYIYLEYHNGNNSSSSNNNDNNEDIVGASWCCQLVRGWTRGCKCVLVGGRAANSLLNNTEHS